MRCLRSAPRRFLTVNARNGTSTETSGLCPCRHGPRVPAGNPYRRSTCSTFTRAASVPPACALLLQGGGGHRRPPLRGRLRATTGVLEYDLPVDQDSVADRVFGQGGSFTSNTCNLGGISASSLCVPTGGGGRRRPPLRRRLQQQPGAGVRQPADQFGGRPGVRAGRQLHQQHLQPGRHQRQQPVQPPPGWRWTPPATSTWPTTSNNRVLEYDTPLTTDTVADRVFGQGGSFTSNTCNLGGISASSLCNPYGVAVDAAGRLYVADASNSRVLEYDNPLTRSRRRPGVRPGGQLHQRHLQPGRRQRQQPVHPLGRGGGRRRQPLRGRLRTTTGCWSTTAR